MYVNCCSSQHRCYTTLFFFNDTATTEIYTLSLHDALPISDFRSHRFDTRDHPGHERDAEIRDRKSTRLNSSHGYISYAVFCLKKMKYVLDDAALCLARISRRFGVSAFGAY